MSLRLTARLVLLSVLLTLAGCSLGPDESPAFVSSFAAKAVADEIVDDTVQAAEAAGTDPTSVSVIDEVVTDNLGELDPEDADVPVVTGITDADDDGLDDDRRFQIDVGDQAACASIDDAGDGKVASGAC